MISRRCCTLVIHITSPARSASEVRQPQEPPVSSHRKGPPRRKTPPRFGTAKWQSLGGEAWEVRPSRPLLLGSNDTNTRHRPTIVPQPIPDYDFRMLPPFTATMTHTPRRSSLAPTRITIMFLLFVFPLAISACAAPAFLQSDIQSEDPANRILAIRAAAEARDTQSVPLLVDRLEDEDRAVRFFTILALDKITGHRFGYDYAMPDVDRRKAVEKWRAYIRRGRKGVAAGEDGTGQAPTGLSVGPAEARRSPVPAQ